MRHASSSSSSSSSFSFFFLLSSFQTLLSSPITTVRSVSFVRKCKRQALRTLYSSYLHISKRSYCTTYIVPSVLNSSVVKHFAKHCSKVVIFKLEACTSAMVKTLLAYNSGWHLSTPLAARHFAHEPAPHLQTRVHEREKHLGQNSGPHFSCLESSQVEADHLSLSLSLMG